MAVFPTFFGGREIPRLFMSQMTCIEVKSGGRRLLIDFLVSSSKLQWKSADMLFVAYIWAPPLLPLPIPAHCQFSCDEKKGSSWGFAWLWTVLDVLEQGADLRYWRKSQRTLRSLSISGPFEERLGSSCKFAGVAWVAVLDHSVASSFPFFRHVGCDHAISGTECCWTFKQTCRASKIHRLHTCKVFHGISYAVAQTWSQFRLPLCKRVIYSYNSSTPKQDFRMPATKSIPTAFPGIPYGHTEHDSWDVLVFLFGSFCLNYVLVSSCF